jgi:hypothetical protein
MNRDSIKTTIETIKNRYSSVICSYRKAIKLLRLPGQPGSVIRLLLVIAAAGISPFCPVVSSSIPAVADNLTVPSIEIMPGQGTVGTNVFVKIINYQPSRQVIVTFGTGTTIGTGTSVGTLTYVATKTTTDSAGYGVADFLVDVYPAGRYMIMADDGVNTLTGGFKINPSINLKDAVSGCVGDVAVVSGFGFAASKLIYLGLDDQKLVTGETDSKGQFSDAKIAIPACPRGNHNIKVQDSENNIATAVYNVRQQMTIMPSTAAVGDNVTIVGTGFGPVSDVTAYFDDKDAGIVQTGTDGGFTTTIKVPACGDGVHRVKVDDRVNKAYKDINISSSLIINPDLGFIGMPVGIQGSGFRPGFPVNMTYDNVKMEGTTVGPNGSFTNNFKIPVSRFGPHTVTVSDGINSQKVIFTVESTAPPVPSAVLPADGERMTKDIHFEWGAVSDPSGVAYTFEIADDPKFVNVIMSQANVVTNYIDITEDSKMLPGKEKPYYWRVKAVDRASNESPFSSVSSFYKGHTFLTILTNMPDWVKWVLAILGLVLFGFMFFWIGHTIRRLRHLDDETAEDDSEYEANEYGYNSGTNDWNQQ